MKNRIGETAATQTRITITGLQTLLKTNKEAFADFLILHGNEGLWINKDALRWAENYALNNDL